MNRQYFKQFKKRFFRTQFKKVHIDKIEDITEWLHWGSKKVKLRLEIPAQILRMHGAFAYSAGVHPFVGAIKEGATALFEYYGAHTPVNIASAHFIDANGSEVGPSELPWIGREGSQRDIGEKGLDPKNGLSLYGPCTSKKIELEFSRLRKILASIEKHGYQPDRYGDIHGTFLRNGADYRFYVSGGKHRAAVLAALGHQKISVTFSKYRPRVVNIDDSASWPLVQQGLLEEEMARAIFLSYFNLDGTQQYHRLGLNHR